MLLRRLAQDLTLAEQAVIFNCLAQVAGDYSRGRFGTVTDIVEGLRVDLQEVFLEIYDLWIEEVGQEVDNYQLLRS